MQNMDKVYIGVGLKILCLGLPGNNAGDESRCKGYQIDTAVLGTRKGPVSTESRVTPRAPAVPSSDGQSWDKNTLALKGAPSDP